MDIPWVAIIMAILAFVGVKKSGAANAQAAVIGAGVGVGSYHFFDPSITRPPGLIENPVQYLLLKY